MKHEKVGNKTKPKADIITSTFLYKILPWAEEKSQLGNSYALFYIFMPHNRCNLSEEKMMKMTATHTSSFT